MRRILSYDSGLTLLIAVYVLACSLIRYNAGLTGLQVSSIVTNASLMFCTFLLIGGVGSLWLLATARPESPFSFLRAKYQEYKLGNRLALALPILMALAVFLPTFSRMKASIPYLSQYSWDNIFIHYDAAIHGGQDAWLLLEPILDYPLAVFLITMCYHVWILLLYVGTPLMCLWHERPQLRTQFLMAYILCWAVLGTVASNLFASVGPCFIEYFYGDLRFQPLMERLANINQHYPILALDVQKELILWREQDSFGLGRGISAMPSMHVSIASLFAILGWQVSRVAGVALSVFLLIIQVGSVLLGYHYAIDGYVSFAATLLIWWVCSKLVRASESLKGSTPAEGAMAS